ncbi:MAG: DUF2723 domain-containing protein [Ignavibacteriae bacterium]|nr:MAG: DUF2723 domain-containing protein [Ignavibacteriota bacterium]
MLKKAASLFWNENNISFLLSAISFSVYLTTLNRSVGFTDSGELASVICTLGIAHPTGYPLFTLLGRCWIMIPSSMEEIIRLNLFSALLTAAAVGLLFKTTLMLHRSAAVFQPKMRKRKKSNERLFIWAAFIASLTVGFSSTFWSQSAAVEVYALHLVLVLLTIWSFVRGLEEQLKEQRSISRSLILFAFILGLSFSNHMTTVLLAPGILWLYFRTCGAGRKSFRRLFTIAPFFILGLSVSAYLMIRSAQDPIFDWGHPATLERLFWHVSGKQFRVWMFSGWDVMQKQLNHFGGNFSSEFHVVCWISIAAGILALFNTSRTLFIFLAVLFCTTLFYAVNYDIFDIDSYFLLSYLVAGVWCAYGNYFILERIADDRNRNKIIAGALLCAFPVIQIFHNRARADETGNKIPQQFVAKAFSDLEPHAVVLASQWDYFISPSLYYQYIRHEREDVTVVDNSLLQNRSWYYLQLEHHAPWLMDRIRVRADLFLQELDKFEHDRPFDFPLIQSRWKNLLSDIVARSIPDHPVYIDARLDREFPVEYRRTPCGLFLRLTKIEDSVEYRPAAFPFSAWKSELPVEKDFIRYYCTMLMFDAYWLGSQGGRDSAKAVLNEILRLEPGNFEAIGLFNSYGKGN